MEPSTTYTLHYKDKTHFRVQTAGVWGDASLYVCDGKTVMFDPLSPGQAVVLTSSKADLVSSHDDFRTGGPAGPVLFTLLQGAEGLAKLAHDKAEVSVKVEPTGRRVFGWQTKELGFMTLTVAPGDWVETVRFDNKPSQQARYRLMPMWAERPVDPLIEEAVTYHALPSDPALFSTEPPKGSNVQDRRPKGQR